MKNSREIKMFSLLMVAITVAGATGGEYPLYIRRPAPSVGKSDGRCLDFQTYKTFDVGEHWSSPYSNCMLSKCVEDNDKLYIEKFRCRSLFDTLDAARLKELNAYCRQSAGDRRLSFPDCCPHISCKQIDGETGQHIALPEHLYPYVE